MSICEINALENESTYIPELSNLMPLVTNFSNQRIRTRVDIGQIAYLSCLAQSRRSLSNILEPVLQMIQSLSSLAENFKLKWRALPSNDRCPVDFWSSENQIQPPMYVFLFLVIGKDEYSQSLFERVPMSGTESIGLPEARQIYRKLMKILGDSKRNCLNALRITCVTKPIRMIQVWRSN